MDPLNPYRELFVIGVSTSGPIQVVQLCTSRPSERQRISLFVVLGSLTPRSTWWQPAFFYYQGVHYLESVFSSVLRPVCRFCRQLQTFIVMIGAVCPGKAHKLICLLVPFVFSRPKIYNRNSVNSVARIIRWIACSRVLYQGHLPTKTPSRESSWP